MASDRLAQLWGIVSSIPRGCVASYGSVGMAMNPPVSGLLIGKWMASCPDGVPWWRVLKADGTLAVGKRDPRFAAEQIQKLEEEGIEFVGDSCPRQFFFVP